MAIKRMIDDLGRIAIPKELRKEVGILEGDLLEISVENGRVILQKTEVREDD